MQNSFLGGDTFTFLSGGEGVSGQGLAYGSFYDTTTQTAATSVPTPMKLNTTDYVNGFSIENDLLGNPTRIKANRGGIYNLQFSAQINRTSGGSAKQIDIWIRINENNVANSNTAITIVANSNKLVAAWNWFLSLDANQYVEIIWLQNDTIDLLYEPENLIVPHPATPSVIATIVEV